jgi:F-type H+-transporting ATPase subunit delta
MAEIATIARPYAEALFKAGGIAAPAALADELQALADVAGQPQLRQFADNPKVTADQVFDLVTSVARPAGSAPLSQPATNLLRTVIDNGRLVALPEIAAQYHALVNGRSGTSDAIVHSAFPIEPQQLQDVVAALERRFGRKLNASVVIDPELIGGIRVVVGDEVLDTSIKVRLEQMKAALTA